MLLGWYLYYYLWIRKILMLKFNYAHLHHCLQLESISCYFVLKNLSGIEDLTILDAVRIVEFVTGKRATVLPLKAIRKGTYYVYETTVKVSLRRAYLMQFLIHFKLVLSYYFYKRGTNYVVLERLDDSLALLSFRDFELFELNFPLFTAFQNPLFYKFIFKKKGVARCPAEMRTYLLF